MSAYLGVCEFAFGCWVILYAVVSDGFCYRGKSYSHLALVPGSILVAHSVTLWGRLL